MNTEGLSMNTSLVGGSLALFHQITTENCCEMFEIHFVKHTIVIFVQNSQCHFEHILGIHIKRN